MKRIISLLLAIMIVLTGCSQPVTQSQSPTSAEPVDTSSAIDQTIERDPSSEATLEEPMLAEDERPNFASLSDPALLQYTEDSIYSDLVAQFNSEDYIIENVSAVYISEEYLEEVAYNSKSNVYFGYTLEELDAQFQGTRYIFSLEENGETVVEEFAGYDDTYDRVVKNVAIGTGVILVCVTVSVVSGGVGAPAAVSMIFATAAKTGTAYALSSGTISAVAAATITGIQTGDFDEAVKAGALAGSESFKWGAITGVIAGGASEAVKLYRSANTIPTPRESELTVLDRTKNSTEQMSFLNGKEVPMNTPGATRPDVVVQNPNGTVRAIEVKNYNLAQSSNRHTLYTELERQVTSRMANLPTGSTQEIVLDVRGRGFSDELIEATITAIRNRLANIYPDISITVLRY